MRLGHLPGFVLLAGCAGTPSPHQAALSRAPVSMPSVSARASEPTASSTASPPPERLVTASPAEPLRLMTPSAAELKARGPTRRLAPKALSSLKKKWSTKIGRTTFRTTMALTNQQVVVGSHGASLEGAAEASDGVYVLAAASGKVARFVPTPGSGDKDVGGVAIDGTDVIFGTDNGQVVKASLTTGAVRWSSAVAGKARPAPALGNLNGTGALDVVIGDEAGDLHALDGDTGQALWVKATGVNDYDARGFIASAAIVDVNGDRIDDAIAGARDGVLTAYDGRSGNELWQHRGGSGIHASPSILDIDGDGRSEVLAAWSYSHVGVFDVSTGQERYSQELEQDTLGIEGLFASPVPLPATNTDLIVQGTAWWGGHHIGGKRDDSVDGVVLFNQSGREFRTNEGRVSASAVVMDLGDDGVWDAVVGTEDGELLALSADGTRSALAKLRGPVEAPAAIFDVDGDGTFEILVASNDGLLTCLETGSRTRPLVSRFRGETSDNRGHFSAHLRFKADGDAAQTPAQPRVPKPTESDTSW